MNKRTRPFKIDTLSITLLYGEEPAPINPLTVRVMQEIGIDMTGHRSKHLVEYLGRVPMRILIVVCGEAEKTCPTVWPGVFQRQFWSFDDPAAAEGTEEERLEKFRKVRDQIQNRIRQWLAEMAAPTLAQVTSLS